MKNILRDVTNHSPQGLGYVITTNICTTHWDSYKIAVVSYAYLTWLCLELWRRSAARCRLPKSIDSRVVCISSSCFIPSNLPDAPPHSPVMCNNLYNYLRGLDARHNYYTYVVSFGFNFGFVFFLTTRGLSNNKLLIKIGHFRWLYVITPL